MTQIRDNIWQVTYTELGKPEDKGYVPLPQENSTLLLDEADMRYIRDYVEMGYEPSFFIKKSAALRGAFTVVGRQRLS
jgi:hypothetical protein